MSYLLTESLTRWSKKVDTMALAKISGHKDINELMTYYRETASQIAERMGLFEAGARGQPSTRGCLVAKCCITAEKTPCGGVNMPK